MYVQNHADPEVTLKMANYFFDHQEQFTEEVLMDYEMGKFLDELSNLVSNFAVKNMR